MYVLGWMAPCVPSGVIALMLRLRAEVRVSRVSFSQNRAGRLTFRGGNSSRLHGKLQLWLVLGCLVVCQKLPTLEEAWDVSVYHRHATSDPLQFAQGML